MFLTSSVYSKKILLFGSFHTIKSNQTCDNRNIFFLIIFRLNHSKLLWMTRTKTMNLILITNSKRLTLLVVKMMMKWVSLDSEVIEITGTDPPIIHPKRYLQIAQVLSQKLGGGGVTSYSPKCRNSHRSKSNVYLQNLYTSVI